MRELYHYGVKGMKWGVRRYQNADGTLTSKGKARQAKQTKKAQKKWDKNARKNWVKSYNKAVDYSNNNFIDKLNEKYKDYDFNSILEKSYREVLGDRPDDPGAVRSLPFYNDANSLHQEWLND